MWLIIIAGVIGLIGALLITSDNKEKRGFGNFSSFIVTLILTVTSSTLIYNRGKAVVLDNMPYSLSQGTVYTVIGVTTNGFATITDEKSEVLWGLYGKNINKMWLVDLAQTNIIAGKKYVIADNPQPILRQGKDRKIFVEVKP